MRTPLPLNASRTAFTVIEVLVAVTIFAIVSTIIFTVFRSALRSQDAGDRGTQNIQRARFVADMIRRDMTNVFFRDETSYNVAITSMIENMEQLRLQAEETGDWAQFNSLYGDPADTESVDNASIGDPYDKGRIIDLQFKGADGGDLDTLTFATTYPLRVGALYRPWGLSRVTYRVDGSWLIRSADTIDTEKRDMYGDPVPKNSPPEFIKMAEGVVKFDLKYAFWFDNQWYEVDNWDSTTRQTRNPRYILGDYEDEVAAQNPTQLAPGSPGWNASLNDQYSEPLDRLPAYIRVDVSFADKKNPRRVEAFESIIRLLPAEETYTPGTELDNDQRDEERTLRDQTYTPIQPGILRKN